MTNKDFSKMLFSEELKLMSNIVNDMLLLKKKAYFIILSPDDSTLEERHEIHDYGYSASEHKHLIFLVDRNLPVALKDAEMQYLLLTGEVKKLCATYCFRGKNEKFNDEISLLFKARIALIGKYLFGDLREMKYFIGTIRNILMDDRSYYFVMGGNYMKRPMHEDVLQGLIDKKSYEEFDYRHSISGRLGNLDDVSKLANPEEEKLAAKFIKESLKKLKKALSNI